MKKMQEYILYVDDTGFNANQKNSLALQNEQATFAGVLINKDLLPTLGSIMEGFRNLLNIRFRTDEFHFTEIYNRNQEFKDIQVDETLDMLGMFAEFFNEFDLRIFVHTCNKQASEAQQVTNDLIDMVAPSLHLPKGPKTQALMHTYFKAKRYVEESLQDSRLSKVVCDEGLRKNGATEIIKPENVGLEFKSSKECPFLQLADYAAWFTTRAKHVLDKASSKGRLSQIDEGILEIYSSLSKNYEGLSEVELDLDNLEDFDYDKVYGDSVEKNRTK